MTKDEFEKMKSALITEEIDLQALKSLVQDQAREKGISPMLQGFANAVISGNDELILISAHRIRSNANFVPWSLMIGSRAWLELQESSR